MKLESLTLSHCGPFERLEIRFEEDLTLIAGINGVGKSTLLRVIATLLSNAYRHLNFSRQRTLRLCKEDVFVGAAEAEADLTINTQGIKLVAELKGHLHRRRFQSFELKGAIDRADHQEMLAVLFTPKRQLPGRPRTLPATRPFQPSAAYDDALHDREVALREFMHWFRTQEKLGEMEEPRRLAVLDTLREVITKLMPEFSNPRIEERPRPEFVVDKHGKPFFLRQLSDGERGLLALVFDLTRRLAIANPESRNPISDGAAVVLIDEIELHMHPMWQREMVCKLRKIFETCQFIITTHSPQVIGEIEARSVRLLSENEGKVVVETPGMAYGADSNWILNVLMGADDQSEAIKSRLDTISQLISDRKLNAAKIKIKALRRIIGNTQSIQRLQSTIDRIEILRK